MSDSTDRNGLTENRYNQIIKMLHDIAKREGIVNPKIELTDGSEKGDGFVGEKSRAILKGDNKSMDLFVKGSPTSETFRKAFDPRPIYLLEIMFYNDIYPIFNKFQTEKCIPKPFTSVIDCIDTCSENGNEILILQNARNLGFELADKMKQLNKEHVEFIYTEYGKYHGVCFALKDQRPKEYKDLVDQFPIIGFEMMAEYLSIGILHMVAKGKDLLDQEKEADKYDRYSAFVDNLHAFILNLAHHKDPYKVIVHGDCWSNNMMFKYAADSDKSRPEKMLLVDFQITGQASPVIDLSYVLYASTPKEIYSNKDHYLRVYHDSLSKTIRDLGSDPEVLFPFAELQNQWKMFSGYGLMMASAVLKICIQEKDEIKDFAEVMDADKDAEPMSVFTTEGRNEAIYHQRFKALIEHMIDSEFI